jgi:hypothetical protein
MAGKISMRARREVVSAVAERYRAAGRSEKGRILDDLCSVTGWRRKHMIRVLSLREKSVSAQQRQRHRTYGPSIRCGFRKVCDLPKSSAGYCRSVEAVSEPDDILASEAVWDVRFLPHCSNRRSVLTRADEVVEKAAPGTSPLTVAIGPNRSQPTIPEHRDL